MCREGFYFVTHFHCFFLSDFDLVTHVALYCRLYITPWISMWVPLCPVSWFNVCFTVMVTILCHSLCDSLKCYFKLLYALLCAGFQFHYLWNHWIHMYLPVCWLPWRLACNMWLSDLPLFLSLTRFKVAWWFLPIFFGIVSAHNFYIVLLHTSILYLTLCVVYIIYHFMS